VPVWFPASLARKGHTIPPMVCMRQKVRQAVVQKKWPHLETAAARVWNGWPRWIGITGREVLESRGGRARNMHRSLHLPKETGGVLFGLTDTSRRIIYAIHASPAPTDSLSYPNAFIRGRSGLRRLRARITETTAGQVDYIGEWHSHPNGYSCAPSSDDNQVLGWISDVVNVEGLPGLMVIAGDEVRFSLHLQDGSDSSSATIHISRTNGPSKEPE